ncbi:CHASE domain-containing protein [Arcobacter acticola]|uniref:CHASE domain-containing protein n=1 Tax=Arcobacter acticola TaxID=1849015 RepID=UPI0015542ED9|nr:CHASE domain-containing protein [Arcobacter acticola]
MNNTFKDKKPIIASVFTFVFVFITLISFYMFYEEKEENKTSEKANLLVQNIVNEIQTKISQGITAVDSQILILKQNNYNPKDFDKWAKELMKEKDSIACLQLAKDGVVSSIYPYEENKSAMGHDLLKDKRRDDGALLAIEKKGITFVGPIKLIQNDKYALIARKPIFETLDDKEKFWGFSTVIIYVDSIMKSLEEKIKDNGFEYQLEGFDPDKEKRPLFAKSKNFKGKDTLEFDINVPNGKWIFTLEKNSINN